MAQAQYIATGRRKINSLYAQYLVQVKSFLTVKKWQEYLPYESLFVIVKQPLAVTTEGHYDIFINVNGGGYAGQSGAARHGIVHYEVDPDFIKYAKDAGLLT